jgi:4-alpha-glucanotransferase
LVFGGGMRSSDSQRGATRTTATNVNLPRSSGILLHPTSLPGGRLGPDAFAFVDWLAAAGQSWWQVLPLGPPDAYGSPYAAASAFAGWAGLLAEPSAPVSASEARRFLAAHEYWARDWAAFDGGDAIAAQVRFQREWSALRDYAAERGVGLIGDLPIYVAGGGADVVSHPELFEKGQISGAPPDALSPTGQRWGNPLYDWPRHRASGYRWWTERFRRALELHDVVRIDHFRGFEAYWAIPEEAETALAGRWRPGPGAELFRAVEAVLGELPVIAEDLGLITKAVERLRDELGFPGMAVLQWAFAGAADNPHRPENHRENLVVYTSTHDTDTALGWWGSLTPAERAASRLDPDEPHWSLIELALASPARLAIVPAQDILGLGNESRMNRPGRIGGNWTWRLEPGQLPDELARRLREATSRSGRTTLTS